MPHPREFTIDSNIFDTPEKKSDAVNLWLFASLQDRARPLTAENKWRELENTFAESQSQTDPAALLLDTMWQNEGTWQLSGGTLSWHTCLMAVLAVPPAEDATEEHAQRAIRFFRTPSTRFRVIRFTAGGNEHVIAAVATGTSLYLFDPAVGLIQVPITDAVNIFTQEMADRHPTPATHFECDAIRVNEVFTTWFGRPDQGERDIDGIIALISHIDSVKDVDSPFRPSVRFCCQKAYLDTSRKLIPEADPVAIEDQLPYQIRPVLRLDRHDINSTNNLNDDRLIIRCVSTVLYHLLQIDLYQEATEIWTLYLLHFFGGYHIDTRVRPKDNNRPVRFNNRETFVPTVEEVHPGVTHRHSVSSKVISKLNHLFIPKPATGLSKLQHILSQIADKRHLAFNRPVEDQHVNAATGRITEVLSSEVEIPALDTLFTGAPRNNEAVKIALQTCCLIWVQSFGNRNNIRPFRDVVARIGEEVIRTSVVTGIGKTWTNLPQPFPARILTADGVEREFNISFP